MSREQRKGGRMNGGQGNERGKTDREKRGNYCSVNGIQSNFLLLKKSFIYVDSLLVMYSSVTPQPPPPLHTHTLSFFTPAVCVCAHAYHCLRVCVYDEAVLLFPPGRGAGGKRGSVKLHR